jgi:uncharacterized protein
MEKRRFGKTGFETSLIGFGGFHLLEIPLSEADYLLNRYLDAGGNYIETALRYGDGESERKIGKSVSARRNEYFLTTKTPERTYQSCLDSLDESLVNLSTDHVDLLIMHAVATFEELETILGPSGALEGALKAKSDGRIKHIGISMHGQPDVLIKALKSYSFDAVMTTVNFYDRFNFPGIEGELLPLAAEKDAAVIVMKPLADGYLWKSAEQAFRYAFSMPASVIVTGINSRALLEKDLEYAETLSPMSADEKEVLYKDSPELGDYVCRQCGLCLPCSEGINIPEVFKYEGYFDRQMFNGRISNVEEYALRERLRFWFNNKGLAKERYSELAVKANKCTECGECLNRCPYKIDIIEKMHIADYKLGEREIF